jgi:Acyltransferase family
MAAGSQTAHGQGVLLQPTSHHIPVLDGWRGIAIALVLFDHVQYALFNGYAHPWLQTGQHGVTIFFVLSGFLITTKLLEGPIDLKRFYIRRFFRLIPVAWIFLVVLLLFDRLTGLRLTTWQEIRSCLCRRRGAFLVAVAGRAVLSRLALHSFSRRSATLSLDRCDRGCELCDVPVVFMGVLRSQSPWQ